MKRKVFALAFITCSSFLTVSASYQKPLSHKQRRQLAHAEAAKVEAAKVETAKVAAAKVVVSKAITDARLQEEQQLARAAQAAAASASSQTSTSVAGPGRISDADLAVIAYCKELLANGYKGRMDPAI